MYDKLNITENHLKILSLFTGGNEFYIREVQKILGISPRTAQLILDDLEKKTVLESKVRGKIKMYKLKKTQAAKDYFIMTEQYKKLCFIKDDMLKEIIEKITPHIKGIALIFGSYVKRKQKKSSDLDVFVAGSYNKEELQNISKLYGIHISVKTYTLTIFKKHIRDDILIREVLDDHIIIKGVEEFVNARWKWTR